MKWYYWYVNMPRCGCVEHGLEFLSFYVQKHKAHLAACSGPNTGSRRAARGAHLDVRLKGGSGTSHLAAIASIKSLYTRK